MNRILLVVMWAGLAVAVGTSQSPHGNQAPSLSGNQVPGLSGNQVPSLSGNQVPGLSGNQVPGGNHAAGRNLEPDGIQGRPVNLGSPVSPATRDPLGTAISAESIVPSASTRPQMATAGDMIGFSHADGSGNLTITLVHTGKSWMSVYHVDSKGTIQLVSSRPIDADFSLQLNATDPLPDEIRAMADRVRPSR